MAVRRSPIRHLALLIVALIANVVACGFLSSFDRYDASRAKLYAIRGAVDGTDGAEVTLTLGRATLNRRGDGPFEFSGAVADGDPFIITASAVRHSCANAEGTIAGRDANGVRIQCTPPPPSDDPALSSLSLSIGPLSVAFDSTKTAYFAGPFPIAILPIRTSTSVIATSMDPGAEIRVRAAVVASGAPSPPIVLRDGPTPIDVAVTSGAGSPSIGQYRPHRY